MRRYVVDGGTAVLTGAAGGIGRALAVELSARGSHLVLLDRDAEGLTEVAETLRTTRPDRSVTTHVVDLADADSTLRTAREILAATPRLDLLVNNAGVALAGRFDQVSLADFQWVVDVNFRAVVILTHTLLPRLVSTPGSHIVNLSSLFGLVSPPGQTAYSASKFAVRGFGDALRAELADRDVGVTTVHPGGIRTRIAESARVGAGVSHDELTLGRATARRLLTIEPEIAARRIVDGLERRRARVLIGATTHALDIAVRLAPVAHARLLAAGDAAMRRRPSR
jgi:short-subunit dehydrogenase